MRIITRPHVEVCWDTRFRGVGHLDFPRSSSHATNVGAFAAKTCYRSFGEVSKARSAEANQRAIVESRHGRILEHINFGLYLSGISRALGNELITHKPGITISQESTRYVDVQELGIVLDPDQADIYERLGLDPESCMVEDRRIIDSLIECAQRCWDEYHDQFCYWYDRNPYGLDTATAIRKFARGKARNVLPLNLETTIVMTGNLRAFRHLIEMRSGEDVEAEFRRLTAKIFEVLQAEAPLYFEDYSSQMVRGYPVYATQFRKV